MVGVYKITNPSGKIYIGQYINERSISNNLIGLSKQTKNKIIFKYK